MELAPGTAVDRFVVEGLVGRGGMASVYRIRHRSLNVAYALKIMHVTHPEIADRIRSEGVLQAELRHPNIVTVFDMVEIGGLPGLVMEYVDGPSMAALIEVHQPTIEQIDDIARGMLKGVRAAHLAGLIHRDLKPANVLLAHTDDGYLPKITDFGLAKSLDGSAATVQTRTGVVMGTPAYMAPEQFRNTRAVDARADIYSLGVVLYELCAGRRPYDETDLFDLLDRIRNADYPRVTELVPSLPDRMADAIDGAMLVDLDERLPNVDALYEVWCGSSRLDRSRVWNRAVLQQIGQSLSETQSGSMEVPGARPAAKSGPQPAPPPPPPPLETAPAPEVLAGVATPEPAALSGAAAQSVATATMPELAAVEAAVAPEPAGAPEPESVVAPEPVAASEPVAATEPAAATESVAASDAVPVAVPLGGGPGPLALSPLAILPEPGGSVDAPDEDGPADERTRFERIVRSGDDPTPPAPTPPAPPAPPIPPAELANASILVSHAVEPELAPEPTKPAVPDPEAPTRRRKVSLTDSTPSLHLPPPTPAPAEIRPASMFRAGTWIAAFGMLGMLAFGSGALLLLVGFVWYISTPSPSTSDPLPPIQVHPKPVATEPTEPGEAGDPEAGEPEAGEPEAGEPEAGEPEAEPSEGEAPPEAAPEQPKPAPVRPNPSPKTQKAKVALTGDATTIRLVSGSQSFGPGMVPVGDYELRATFPGQGELKQRATVHVRAGAVTTINCVSGFFSCTAK